MDPVFLGRMCQLWMVQLQLSIVGKCCVLQQEHQDNLQQSCVDKWCCCSLFHCWDLRPTFIVWSVFTLLVVLEKNNKI